MSEDDAIVRSSNDDATATGCKRAAVQLGYWKDPYINYFIRASERKAPEINRGFYARVRGVHTLLKQFLEITKCEGQIVNLGAGFDTTYWNLKDEDLAPKLFIEVDFQGITHGKSYYLQHRQPLLEKLSSEDEDVKFNNSDLHSAQYHIVSADLRNTTELEKKLTECGVDFNLPTCFLTECVLIYMPAEASTALVRWIPNKFKTAFFVNYEQVNMGDRFGKVMIDNLKSRGCNLSGVKHCLSLDTQKQRFLTNGWKGSDAINMLHVYRSLSQADAQRFHPMPSAILVDLSTELFSHYCLVWAHIGPDIGLSRVCYIGPQSTIKPATSC